MLARLDGVGRHAGIAFYVLALVAVVAGVDVAFFEHHALERLIVNIAIVAAFGFVYLRFVRPRS
jgi:hypothetical protein